MNRNEGLKSCKEESSHVLHSYLLIYPNPHPIFSALPTAHDSTRPLSMTHNSLKNINHTLEQQLWCLHFLDMASTSLPAILSALELR